jgi:hypothetical protein
MTRFGMKEPDFDHLAQLMADIIIRSKNVGDEVAEYRQQFQTMHYCLGLDETLKIAPAIFESLFPSADYFQGVTRALSQLKS